MKKHRGVSVKVDENFYRMMEKARLQMQNNYGLNIKSHQKLTKIWANNEKLFINKKLAKQIKRCYK